MEFERDYSAAGLARACRRAQRTLGSRVRRAVFGFQNPGLSYSGLVYLGPNVDINLGRGSEIHISGCWICSGVVLHTGPDANISLEAAFVGHGSVIVARERVSIGVRTEIAEHVTIRDASHDHRFPLRAQVYKVSPVTIGSDVWIGAKATILPGVTVGDGATVGAGAVVTRDVPGGATVVGVPGRILKQPCGDSNC